jgi:hypothetical protein
MKGAHEPYKLKSSWDYPPLVLALLGLVVLAVFTGTLSSEWTYDDFPVIVNNPDIRSFGGFWQDNYPGRPIRELTYLLDHWLFGLKNAGAWHWQNLVWHGLSAFGLWLLARKLGVGKTGAWIAAILFAVHPLQVEVVANISHRKDGLLACFSLFSAWAFLQGVEGHGRPRWWCFAMAAGYLAWLSKEPAIMLPFLWLALFFLYGSMEAKTRKIAWRIVAAGLVIVSAAGGVWLWQFGGVEKYAHDMVSIIHRRTGYTEEITFGLYLLTIAKSWGFLWLKVFWPFPLALEYHIPAADTLLDPLVFAAVLLFAAIAVAIIKCRKTAPAAAFGLLWSVGMWLPLSNLWPLVYLAADRYMYVPLAGIALVAGWWGERMLAGNTFRPLLIMTLLGVGFVLAILSWQQTRVWHDSFTLWSQAVKVSPASSYALNNLGNCYLQEGDWVNAERYFSFATANQFNPNPHDNLGWLCEKRGNWSCAVQHYQEFIRLADRDVHSRKRVDYLTRHLAERGVPLYR